MIKRDLVIIGGGSAGMAAAIEAKKNAPKRDQTCYFQRAQLKREAARVAKKKSVPKRTKAQDKTKTELE